MNISFGDKDWLIFSGDVIDSLKRIPDGSVRLVVTSPPYNLGKEYEKEIGLDGYLDLMKPVIGELYRVLAKDGSICWQVGNYVNKGEVIPLDICFYRIKVDFEN